MIAVAHPHFAPAEYRFAQSQTESDSSQGRRLLQQGIALYEAERFSEAESRWQEAFSILQTEADHLGQALALNNLSLAYQQMGRWQEAETTIADSLALLGREQTAQSQPGREILGKAFNTQGNVLWNRGQAELALQVWQQAEQSYRTVGNRSGTIMTQINQVKALQELGLNTRAVNLLEQLYQQLNQESAAQLRATGLRYLGEAYRRIGDLERSRQILQTAVAQLQPSTAQAAALLELGNTEKLLSDRAITIGKVEQAQSYARTAIQSYQAAIQASESSTLQRQARLNQLHFLIETGQWAEANALWPQIQPQVTQLPLNRTSIYSQLNFVDSLSCLKHLSLTQELDCVSPERRDYLTAPAHLPDLPTWESMARLVAAAVEQARSLDDALAESYALGQLGRLYELNGQWLESQRLTQEALLRLEGIQAPEAAYQWLWQLGRLLKQQENRAGAIAAYREAIHSLETVQKDLLLISSETRFSFRDKVEPVYREFTDLLLAPEREQEPVQENLRLAIQMIDALQLVELQNFLGCDLPQVRIGETVIDPGSAKIYPILLPERLVVILEIPEQPLTYYEVPVDRQTMEATIRQLRRYLTEPGQTPEVLQEASKLYEWIIAPLEPALADYPSIRNLVFVPDGELRNIPMGVLYDGHQYLIEKGYAIAIAPRLELFQPKPLSANLSILAGGIGIPQVIEGVPFSEIQQLREEIEQIPTNLLRTPPLFDQAFTIANIEQQLKSGRYSAIHWKTHGVFSSDPAETFIVAYQSSIRTSNLVEIVQGARQSRAEPLELLILSACETARGDNRAVLGMAGTAMNAGASSIVSTLWRADDAANTTLMADFYQALLQSGTTRAEALQQAQLALLKQYGYPAPYYWATYVLVGNWL